MLVQMIEFVANYRRSNNIAGKLSYSNLYTSISVLAGHYASYGPKFPVPEKRRKRLMQVYLGFQHSLCCALIVGFALKLLFLSPQDVSF